MMRMAASQATRSLRSVRVHNLDPYTRHIHVTSVASKSVTGKVSEVADKLNKKVGQGLASAIETGEKATEKTKETLGSSTETAKQKAEHAKQAAHETGEHAKQTAQQTGEQAKQKVNEAGSKARETKEDVKRDL
ncbi:hypothetical protein HYDPIDRAFT_37223 [Hydnomerulius pinastri MD-312]|nr:hypothetical protein HYDPIDRAFT_37223 [Hydnomerulius pinastri MD-312]